MKEDAVKGESFIRFGNERRKEVTQIGRKLNQEGKTIFVQEVITPSRRRKNPKHFLSEEKVLC